MDNQSLELTSDTDEKIFNPKKFEGFKAENLYFLLDEIQGNGKLLQKLDSVCKSMRPTHKSKFSSPISNYQLDEDGHAINVKLVPDKKGNLVNIDIDYVCIFPKHSNVKIIAEVNENPMDKNLLVVKNQNTKNNRIQEYNDGIIDKEIRDMGIKSEKDINIHFLNKISENKVVFDSEYQSDRKLKMSLVGNIWEYHRNISIENGEIKDKSNFKSYRATQNEKLDKIKEIYQQIHPLDWDKRFNIIKKELLK